MASVWDPEFDLRPRMWKETQGLLSPQPSTPTNILWDELSHLLYLMDDSDHGRLHGPILPFELQQEIADGIAQEYLAGSAVAGRALGKLSLVSRGLLHQCRQYLFRSLSIRCIFWPSTAMAAHESRMETAATLFRESPILFQYVVDFNIYIAYHPDMVSSFATNASPPPNSSIHPLPHSALRLIDGLLTYRHLQRLSIHLKHAPTWSRIHESTRQRLVRLLGFNPLVKVDINGPFPPNVLMSLPSTLEVLACCQTRVDQKGASVFAQDLTNIGFPPVDDVECAPRAISFHFANGPMLAVLGQLPSENVENITDVTIGLGYRSYEKSESTKISLSRLSNIIQPKTKYLSLDLLTSDHFPGHINIEADKVTPLLSDLEALQHVTVYIRTAATYLNIVCPSKYPELAAHMFLPSYKNITTLKIVFLWPIVYEAEALKGPFIAEDSFQDFQRMDNMIASPDIFPHLERFDFIVGITPVGFPRDTAPPEYKKKLFTLMANAYRDVFSQTSQRTDNGFCFTVDTKIVPPDWIDS